MKAVVPEAPVLRAVVVINHTPAAISVGAVQVGAERIRSGVGGPHQHGLDPRVELTADAWRALSDTDRAELARLEAKGSISIVPTPAGAL